MSADAMLKLPGFYWAHHEVRAATTLISFATIIPLTLSLITPSLYAYIFHHITTIVLYLVTAVVVTREIAQGGKFDEFKHLDGKVALVTGGAGGIGYRNSIQLTRMGATVFVGMRGGPSRGDQVVRDIKREAGLSEDSDKVQYIELDLMSFDSVRAAAADFKKRSPTLDILLNNAGIMAVPYKMTGDNHESQMQTNHLSHFLLTDLLIDYLKASKGRIVNVSSLGHTIASKGIQYENALNKSTYNPWTAYGYSKLANIYFTQQLQAMNGKDGVTAYAVHPGSVATDLVRNLSSFEQVGSGPLLFVIGKTPEQGSLTSLYCCISDQAVPGAYHSDCTVAPTAPIAGSTKRSEEFWRWSKEQMQKK